MKIIPYIRFYTYFILIKREESSKFMKMNHEVLFFKWRVLI